MSKGKKARRDEAIKKAKQKKVITICVCVGVVALIAIFVIVLTSQGDGSRNDVNTPIDLTVMSATMAHTVVQNINDNPNQHLGRTITARGRYIPVFDNASQRDIHHILVEGTDGCCQQSLMFILKDGGPYPAENTLIEISGTVSRTDEFGSAFYHIAADNIIIA